MHRFYILGYLFLFCFSLEASEALNNARSRTQGSWVNRSAYEIEQEKALMWREIKQKARGFQIEDLWVRVMFPRIGTIETAYQALQTLIASQRQRSKLLIAGYYVFNYDGTKDKQETMTEGYSVEDIKMLQPNQLLLIGLTNGDIGFIIGSAVTERYRSLRRNRDFEAIDELVQALYSGVVGGRPPLQLTEAQTRTLLQAPNYVRDNIIANYKCELVQNHEVIAREIAAAFNVAVQNQGQQPAPIAALVQNQAQVQVQQNQQPAVPQTPLNQAQQAPALGAASAAQPASAAQANGGGGYGRYVVGGIVIIGICVTGAWWAGLIVL